MWTIKVYRIFADPTEASNGMEIKASDWSNLRFKVLLAN